MMAGARRELPAQKPDPGFGALHLDQNSPTYRAANKACQSLEP